MSPSGEKKADAPFTIPMPGTSSRERDVRPYTRGFEDESRPREDDRDIASERDLALVLVLANTVPSPSRRRADAAIFSEAIEQARKSLRPPRHCGSGSQEHRLCRRSSRHPNAGRDEFVIT